MRLSGPSGSLRVIAWRRRESDSDTIDREILRSLGHPTFFTIQRLVISGYEPPVPREVGESSIFRALSLANNLRTLIFINCSRSSLVHPLDPENNPSRSVLCFNMEELVLYIDRGDESLTELINMTKNRASRGAKLSSIKIVSLHGIIPEKAVSELKEHVAYVFFFFNSIFIPVDQRHPRT